MKLCRLAYFVRTSQLWPPPGHEQWKFCYYIIQRNDTTNNSIFHKRLNCFTLKMYNNDYHYDFANITSAQQLSLSLSSKSTWPKSLQKTSLSRNVLNILIVHLSLSVSVFGMDLNYLILAIYIYKKSKKIILRLMSFLMLLKNYEGIEFV